MFLNKYRLLAGFLALAVSALAVTGVVLDNLGAPLSGVKVELVTDGSTVNTTSDGSFLLTPAATTATNPGFAAIRVTLENGILQFTLPQSVKGSMLTMDILGNQINSVPSKQFPAGVNQYNPLGNDHANPGIYLVSFQFGSQKGVLKLAVTNVPNNVGKTNTVTSVLRRTAVGALDSVKFSKQGYTTKSLAINAYADNLGAVLMYGIMSSNSTSASSSVTASSSSVQPASSSSSLTPVSSSIAVSSSVTGYSSVTATSSTVTTSSSSVVPSSSSAIPSSSSTTVSSSIAVSSSSVTVSSSMATSSSSVSYLNPAISYGVFTDSRDGQEYKTTVIGTQTWMAQNLNYSGDNGSGIRTYTTGWCYGVGVSDTTQHQEYATCDGGYGRLYHWADAMDISSSYLTTTARGVATNRTTGVKVSSTTNNRGLCPVGWHVPSTDAWDSLAAFIRIDKGVTSNNEGKYLKAVISPDPISWNSATYNAQDPYGFSAVPAGYRDYTYNYVSWFSRGSSANFWSTSEYASYAFGRYLDNNYAHLNSNLAKTNGFSLRCTRD